MTVTTKIPLTSIVTLRLNYEVAQNCPRFQSHTCRCQSQLSAHAATTNNNGHVRATYVVRKTFNEYFLQLNVLQLKLVLKKREPMYRGESTMCRCNIRKPLSAFSGK